jgi:hypothetical protein
MKYATTLTNRRGRADSEATQRDIGELCHANARAAASVGRAAIAVSWQLLADMFGDLESTLTSTTATQLPVVASSLVAKSAVVATPFIRDAPPAEPVTLPFALLLLLLLLLCSVFLF